MPRIDGDTLNKLCESLNRLGRRGRVTPAVLMSSSTEAPLRRLRARLKRLSGQQNSQESQDDNLYKERYKTFEDYRKGKWGFDQQHADFMISAIGGECNELSIMRFRCPKKGR